VIDTSRLQAATKDPACKVDVSVVLPVYNEAGHLEDEVERIRASLEASPYSYEIVVVDDGSTDGSAERLACLEHVRLISFGHNRGSGAARRAGTRAAAGEVIVWTDVDMTYPNDDIPRLVEALRGADQVVGARRKEAGSARVLRITMKWLIRKLAGYLSRTSIPDLNSGFRAFRASVGRQFIHRIPNGFSCVTTITMCFLMNGYVVKYVPIDYAPRAGRSKFHWWKDTRRYIVQVVRLVMFYDPLRVFVPIALVLFAVGTGKLGYDIVANPVKVATNTLLVLFGAFQALAIGLLADLLVHMTKPWDEVDPVARHP
jgi:glycosyltransferase involved in cell wall biosynthesis